MHFPLILDQLVTDQKKLFARGASLQVILGIPDKILWGSGHLIYIIYPCSEDFVQGMKTTLLINSEIHQLTEFWKSY